MLYTPCASNVHRAFRSRTGSEILDTSLLLSNAVHELGNVQQACASFV
jgi:hypothetical protein